MIRKLKLPMLAGASILLAACSSDDPPIAPLNDATPDQTKTIHWSICPDEAVL